MSYTVGTYWGQRKESRQACAIAIFLQALAAQDAGLSRWYKPLASRKQSLREWPHDVDRLVPLLGVNRGDIGGEIIVELGFDFFAWNGWKTDLPASLVILCGAFSPVASNRAVVSFDPEASPTLDLLQGMLRAAVTAFDPEEGIAISHATRSTHRSLPFLERPAVFRYKRDVGFSVD